MNSLALTQTLKTARVNKGLSQEALAEETKISLRTIQRIEKGQVNPRLYTVKTLSEKLDIDLSKLQTEMNTTKTDYAIINKMNMAIIVSLFIPLGNIITVVIFSSVKSHNIVLKRLKGKILSLQILWTVFTSIAFFLTVFLNNLITNDSGNATYISFLAYALCILINIIIMCISTLQLNNGNKKILRFAPNFFS